MKARDTPIEAGSLKEKRKRQVLLSLIERYIAEGVPIGSATLQDLEFQAISSATIRNYFAELEKEGYLKQLHTSGGRVPTEKAFRVYAQTVQESNMLPQGYIEKMQEIAKSDTKEIAALLQQTADALSRVSGLAVFLSSPRFDHDIITQVRLLPIDTYRLLAVTITEFGLIRTQTLRLQEKLSLHSIKRIEEFIQAQVQNLSQAVELSEKEKTQAEELYREVMVNYVIHYSSYTEEDIYKTGFSRLLEYPDFQEISEFASVLSLFENANTMRTLLRQACKKEQGVFWIGSDLSSFNVQNPTCSILSMPYKIGGKCAGAIGVVGPMRLSYKLGFGTLKATIEMLSKVLSSLLYRYKISYREAKPGHVDLFYEEQKLLEMSTLKDKGT